MLGFIKSLFGSKPAEPVAEVPYKVETASVEVVPTVEAVVVPEAIVPAAVVEQAPVNAPAKKAPAKKAPAKKPRRPRAPKVAK
jgi:hypothetical protein